MKRRTTRAEKRAAKKQRIGKPSGNSRYGRKRHSGKMLYGPGPTTPPYPQFQLGRTKVICERCHIPWNECSCDVASVREHAQRDRRNARATSQMSRERRALSDRGTRKPHD